MANLRRRSARLSKTDSNQCSPRKTPVTKARLGSLVERDETPDTVQQSIDGVLATPTTARAARDRLSELEGLKTPQTEPRPEKSEMDPKTAHRSTAKAPDSGLKLGFSDISTKDKKNDTPSKSATKANMSTGSTFDFKFSSDPHMSSDARKMMESLRDDAAKIKAQLLAEKAEQEQKGEEPGKLFGAGRKIAQPRGKASRFSDIHMAQFKKMDSIANHASAFRARPGFAAPTTQSLKRSPSKAGLDERERPRTAGKGTPNQRRAIPPPVTGRPASLSPFKSIHIQETRGTPGPAKRIRQADHQDVSESRPAASTTKVRPSLYSPTKASLARTTSTVESPNKSSKLPRLGSSKSVKAVSSTTSNDTGISPHETHVGSVLATSNDPAQPQYPSLPPSPERKNTNTDKSTFTSKLPTLSGLKSILRGTRKDKATPNRPGTPKRRNTGVSMADSAKKVDFTPSVKSRYAVKLAEASPSPAKRRQNTPFKATAPAIPYDSSAYLLDNDGDKEWEDEDNEITYPTLPQDEVTGPIVRTLSAKAKELSRCESKEFKSIFTNLHPNGPESATKLTSINTAVNRTNPTTHVNRVMRSTGNLGAKPSPSTIRQVRDSQANDLVQPFEDEVKTVPHGIPGKKRHHASIIDNDKYGTDEDAKENRRISALPAVPGGWDENSSEESDEQADGRPGKRARTTKSPEKLETVVKSPVKKPNAAREAAAKNAKERKGKGVLSLSRLNMLSRPRTRG